MWVNAPCTERQADAAQHLLSLGGQLALDPATDKWAIDLTGTSCSDRDVPLLLALDEIDEFYLSHTRISPASLSTINQLASLEVLELENLPLGDQEVQQLGTLGSLQMLNLAGTEISDAALVAFRHCRRMWCLDLDGTRIRGAGLKAVANLPLEWLFLSRSQFSDHQIGILEQFPHLERLEITNTPVTRHGLAMLRQQHPKCQVIAGV